MHAHSTGLPPLPPHVQARVDELVAAAPPLSPAQEQLIRPFFSGQPSPERSAS